MVFGLLYIVGVFGQGFVVVSVMIEVFKMMVYILLVLFGWMVDVKYGWFKMVCWGVGICGVVYVMMVLFLFLFVFMVGKVMVLFVLFLYMLVIGVGEYRQVIN